MIEAPEMFDTPESVLAYRHAHGHAAASRSDALVALGLALLRPSFSPPLRPPEAAPLGAEVVLGAEAARSQTREELVRAELRAGRQKRVFTRGILAV